MAFCLLLYADSPEDLISNVVLVIVLFFSEAIGWKFSIKSPLTTICLQVIQIRYRDSHFLNWKQGGCNAKE